MENKKDLERHIEKEEEEINKIERQIINLTEKLLEKRPSQFSQRDIVNAFFASLLVGLTFVFKGAMISTAVSLKTYHLLLILASTILVLTAEIYYVGYSRVREKARRRFGQFWLKRFSTFFTISILTAAYLIYVFGINNVLGSNENIIKTIIMLSMPCAVGAAIPGLLKQY